MLIKFSSPVSQSVGSSKQKCWLTFKALMSAAHSLILIYSSTLRQNIKSLVFVSTRAAELPWIALHPPFGAEGGELHECSECFFISPFSFLFFSLTKQNRSFLSGDNIPVANGGKGVCFQGRHSDCAPGFCITVWLRLAHVACVRVCVMCYSDLVCGHSGWIRRECCWFPDFIAAETGWHQSQQAGHESAAFCCHGKIWNLGVVQQMLK